MEDTYALVGRAEDTYGLWCARRSRAEWHTKEHSASQHCIEEVDLEVEG